MKKSSSRPVAVKRAASSAKRPAASRRSRDANNAAIASEIAPAVAIAALEQSKQAPGEPPAALDVLAAGASPSEVAGKVRMQLMFENGAVLPVELSADAGAALSDGLSAEVPAAKKAKARRAKAPARKS